MNEIIFKIFNNKKKLYLPLILIFSVAYFFAIAVFKLDEILLIFAPFALYIFFTGHRYTLLSKFKTANSIDFFITKEGEHLIIQNSQLIKGRQIEIKCARISIVTIKDNYLSIIVDGNGNGYDFYPIADRDQIKHRIITLLNKEQVNNICFNIF
ncbi:hypothetical protein CWB96_18560 [Pseudoalteromonas citrea]|uniref:Uncharacterized protein n=1 Tax=Pseudoalteromonas citrea TaxID=43655 RepID=A0A5S3XJQ0_9GAMM|nr:hypothetical protein [Pseudoalteromonas citrea]TMP40608.1 hypothetical protein CWB97_17820 [Pseudoalteromonas citrea]TMP54767.1 hypothetical protein CWB96_18560 [Pseudoalteromonas citrea]